MSEHPPVLVETLVFETWSGNERPVQRRGFGYRLRPVKGERTHPKIAEHADQSLQSQAQPR